MQGHTDNADRFSCQVSTVMEFPTLGGFDVR